MALGKIPVAVLRIGVAFVFFYAAIAGLMQPENWIGYFPQFLRKLVPETLLLGCWAIFEIIIASWILSGKKIFIPSALASLSLAGLIVFNIPQMDVIFRDISILCTSVALAINSYNKPSSLYSS